MKALPSTDLQKCYCFKDAKSIDSLPYLDGSLSVLELRKAKKMMKKLAKSNNICEDPEFDMSEPQTTVINKLLEQSPNLLSKRKKDLNGNRDMIFDSQDILSG